MKKVEIERRNAKRKIQCSRIEYLTSVAVGFAVTVAAGEADSPEFQIMPEDEFKSGVEDFWSWHVETNEQWFDTMLEAAAQFVFRRHQFALNQCPNRNDDEHKEFEKVFQICELRLGKIG